MSEKSEIAGAFKQQVCAKGCSEHGKDCRGRLDAAHWIPAQRIRWQLKGRPEAEIDAAVYDPRVARCLCREAHAKEPFTVYYRDDLPAELWDFADEYDLEWSLKMDYPSYEQIQEAGL